jgi:hypothetical protein
VRHRVAFFVFFRPEEGTKGAVHVTDIRIVNRGIDDVRYNIRSVELHAARVSRRTQLMKVGLIVYADALFEGESASCSGFFEESTERHQ